MEKLWKKNYIYIVRYIYVCVHMCMYTHIHYLLCFPQNVIYYTHRLHHEYGNHGQREINKRPSWSSESYMGKPENLDDIICNVEKSYPVSPVSLATGRHSLDDCTHVCISVNICVPYSANTQTGPRPSFGITVLCYTPAWSLISPRLDFQPLGWIAARRPCTDWLPVHFSHTQDCVATSNLLGGLLLDIAQALKASLPKGTYPPPAFLTLANKNWWDLNLFLPIFTDGKNGAQPRAREIPKGSWIATHPGIRTLGSAWAKRLWMSNSSKF